MSSPPRVTRFSTPKTDRGPALSSPIRSSSISDFGNVYTPQAGFGSNELHLTKAVTALVYQILLRFVNSHYGNRQTF
ncbi:hypothetical protein K435DRAFT_879702 [Dendrothele bispora CBS 962.96]|uniref:Uncharacterized protein n=1 Tax=Dendrothele bispora (strain CBS 962.96) TaxID=1314807 RepID=A0A4S8KKT1_DENBC|nr:hypothetical protein K435DRAFT_879702 [Dendrothele bispora CBS 962.96]